MKRACLNCFLPGFIVWGLIALLSFILFISSMSVSLLLAPAAAMLGSFVPYWINSQQGYFAYAWMLVPASLYIASLYFGIRRQSWKIGLLFSLLTWYNVIAILVDLSHLGGEC